MRGAVKNFMLVAAVCLLPAVAFAQATITGTVRDTSNAVLPGVTIEATSPALLAPRVAVTDDNGIYRLINMPSGSYTLAYTLAGFSRVLRDNIAVSGAGVFTIPAEMKVGGITETITVVSETPVVDVQSTRRGTVLTAEVISTLPATRNYGAILAAVPGIEVSGVGGGAMVNAQTTPEITFFTARGGANTEGRVMIDGMNVAAAFSGGGVSSLVYNTTDTTEIQVLIAGGLGENETGGPSMNLIPRSGGNRFAGQAFYNAAGRLVAQRKHRRRAAQRRDRARTRAQEVVGLQHLARWSDQAGPALVLWDIPQLRERARRRRRARRQPLRRRCHPVGLRS